MKCYNVMNEYSLVYKFFKQPIMQLSDGYFSCVGYERGVLVKRVHHDGTIWYHRPEDYLVWKSYLKEKE